VQQLHYTCEPYKPDNPTVGLILLQTDEVMEEELRAWLPTAIRLFHSRVPSALDVTPATLRTMEAEIPRAVRLLPATDNLRVIAYGCTSGTTIIGEAEVEAAVGSVAPHAAVTNPLTAVKAQLSDLGIQRIGLVTPYEPEVSHEMFEHLNSHGFSITQAGSFHEQNDQQVSRITAQSIQNAVQLIGEHDDCDAVFASCTNLRTYDLLQRASDAIGKPVISSNSALAWHIQKLLSTVVVTPGFSMGVASSAGKS